MDDLPGSSSDRPSAGAESFAFEKLPLWMQEKFADYRVELPCFFPEFAGREPQRQLGAEEAAKEDLLHNDFISKDDLEIMHVLTVKDRENYAGELYDGYLDFRVAINDPVLMEDYISKNLEKILWMDFLERKLKEFITECASQDLLEVLDAEGEWSIATMIRVIGVLLRERQSLLQENIEQSLSDPEKQEEIKALRKRCSYRIDEAVNDLNQTVIGLDKQNIQLKQELLEAEVQLKAAKNYILQLQERHTVPEPHSQEAFIQELQYRMVVHENMNSSLLDELQMEREEKEAILNQYLESEAKRISDQNQQLLEIAEAVKNLEMQDIFRDAIIAKIQSLTPNPHEVKKAVDKWLRTINREVEKRGQELFALTKDLEARTSRCTTLEKERRQLLRGEKEMNETLSKITEELSRKKREIEAIQEELAALEEDARVINVEDARDRYMEKETQTSAQGVRQPPQAAKIWDRPVRQEPVKKTKTFKSPKGMKKMISSPARASAQVQRTPPLPSSSRGMPAVDIIPATPMEPRQRISHTASPKSFNQIVLLTSAKRKDPVVVNIGVDPKPLTDTGNGEVFTCDVSVDVQPGKHGAIPKVPGIAHRRALASPHRLSLPSTSTGRHRKTPLQPRWNI